MERPVKHPRESRAESVYILMPGDINGDGRLFGGQLMQWIDIVAAVVATGWNFCTRRLSIPRSRSWGASPTRAERPWKCGWIPLWRRSAASGIW